MRSQAHYESWLRAHSRILKFANYNAAKAAGQPIEQGALWTLDTSDAGLRYELRQILGTDDEAGALHACRQRVKEIMAEQDRKNTAAGIRLGHMPDNILDDLNKLRARVKVMEEESRAIHQILETRAAKAKQRQSKETTTQRMVRELSFKAVEGRLVEFGGREVTQNEDGVDVFVDDPSGETVAQYKARIQQERKAKSRAKRRRERQEQLQRELNEIQAEM